MGSVERTLDLQEFVSNFPPTVLTTGQLLAPRGFSLTNATAIATRDVAAAIAASPEMQPQDLDSNELHQSDERREPKPPKDIAAERLWRGWSMGAQGAAKALKAAAADGRSATGLPRIEKTEVGLDVGPKNWAWTNIQLGTNIPHPHASTDRLMPGT